MPLTDLDAYNPEYEGLFSAIADHIQRGRPPANDELLLLVRWKLGRLTDSHRHLIVTTGDRIRQLLAASGLLHGRNASIQELISLNGVKVALASAWLTACWPDVYSVLDWRSLEELQSAGCSKGQWPLASDKWAKDVDGYLHRFLPAVEQFRRQNRLKTFRQADRVLWGRSIRKQIQTGLSTEAIS